MFRSTGHWVGLFTQTYQNEPKQPHTNPHELKRTPNKHNGTQTKLNKPEFLSNFRFYVNYHRLAEIPVSIVVPSHVVLLHVCEVLE